MKFLVTSIALVFSFLTLTSCGLIQGSNDSEAPILGDLPDFKDLGVPYSESKLEDNTKR